VSGFGHIVGFTPISPIDGFHGTSGALQHAFMSESRGDMTKLTNRRRLLRTALIVTTIGGLTATGVTVAWSEDTPPQLSLVASADKVTLQRFESEQGAQVYVDLGTHLVAGKDPFEIRVTRQSYKDPIVAHQIVHENGTTKSVKLPDELIKDFSGFPEFAHINIADSAGKAVYDTDVTYCPNVYESGRTRPDAPDSSPYPFGCPRNPFTLGSVWGIQAGWNAPVGPLAPIDLPVGEYKATVSINDKYREYFKIPADRSSVKLDATVEKAEGGGVGLGATQASSAAHDHSAHDTHKPLGTQGDPQHQVSSFLPEMRAQDQRPAAVARAAVPDGPRPDLRSLPASNVSLDTGTAENGMPQDKTFVRFSATVWNAGPSPLIVDGFRQRGGDRMDAYQYFYDASGKQVGSYQAGTMEWDKRPGHMHWHFTDFAQYRLLRADKTLAVTSGKEAFCLANTDAVDYTVPNAKWRPGNTDLSTSCGQQTSLAIRQVLDVGNGDTYVQSLEGQAIEVTDLPNGTYYIEVVANPVNKLLEASTENNSALREITLGGTKEARTITVPPHEGITG
jgi:hypothetical protein